MPTSDADAATQPAATAGGRDDVDARSERPRPDVGAPYRDSVVDRHRTTVLTVGATYLAVVAVAPLATTPMRSDDLISRDVPQDFADSGRSFVQYMLDWFVPWMTEEGRFFPGSALYTFTVFSVFQTRLTYKLYIAALVLLMIVLVATTVSTLLRAVPDRHPRTDPAGTGTPAVPAGTVVPVVVAATVATLTLRNWFDGLDTFSGLLPFTVCATLAAALLLLTGRGVGTAVLAASAWTVVLTTYEVAVLLTPTLCLLVWWVRRRVTRTLPLLVPAAAFSALSLWLRSGVPHGYGDAYRVNLDLDRVVPTYAKQALAALPMSEQWFPGGSGLAVSTSLVAVTAAVVGIPTAVLLVVAARGPVHVPVPSLLGAALLGASAWLLPPLLVAVSLGWQNELPRGQGYVSVVWGYVGVAVLLAVAWLALARSTGAARPRWRSVALHGLTAVIAVAAAGSVSQTIAVASLLTTPA